MPITKGDTVRVHYTGTLADGTVFDSSREREPLEFVLGGGMIIPGFEQAVQGREAGDTVTVTIAPADAYGEADPDLVFTVDRAQMPDSIPLKVGTPLQLSSEQGQMDVVISEVTDTEVTLDANHPLWAVGSYHYAEPEMGYFLSQDEWVIRKDMSMLTRLFGS